VATAPEIRKSIAGLSARELSWRGGSAGWSIREYVHHLVEANLVASTIVLAALGSPGCEFDWSWMMPDERWMKGLRYDRSSVEPALVLLESLGAHVGGLVRTLPDAMRRHVRLVGTRGGRSRRRSVAQVLGDECAHVRQHLRDIAETKRAHEPARARDRAR
jgi:hypothetical protein